MNRDHDPNESNAESDALNAWLDRLNGWHDGPPATPSPEMRRTVDRLFTLAATAEQDETANRTRKEPTMTTAPMHLPIVGDPDRTGRSNVIRHRIRQWTQPMHVLSTAALIVLAFAGVFFAVTNGTRHDGGGNGNDGGLYGAVPLATVPANAIYAPKAADCTATPRSKEELKRILRTPPDPASTLTDARQSQGPVDSATAKQIMTTFQQFQACTLRGTAYRFSASITTDEAVRLYFYGEPVYGKPNPAMSPPEISARVDNIDVGYTADGTPVTRQAATASPAPSASTVLTLFPGDIVLRSGVPQESTPSATPAPNNGPVIVATAYWVNPDTREVQIQPSYQMTFVNVNGQWLINRMGPVKMDNRG